MLCVFKSRWTLLTVFFIWTRHLNLQSRKKSFSTLSWQEVIIHPHINVCLCLRRWLKSPEETELKCRIAAGSLSEVPQKAAALLTASAAWWQRFSNSRIMTQRLLLIDLSAFSLHYMINRVAFFSKDHCTLVLSWNDIETCFSWVYRYTSC